MGSSSKRVWSIFMIFSVWCIILDPPLKTPSCILPREAGLGGLFHGGFKAVMNVDFLKKEGVTHIVNTAKGLETQFGPRYAVRLIPKNTCMVIQVFHDQY